jgi:hypothetical protein
MTEVSYGNLYFHDNPIFLLEFAHLALFLLIQAGIPRGNSGNYKISCPIRRRTAINFDSISFLRFPSDDLGSRSGD